MEFIDTKNNTPFNIKDKMVICLNWGGSVDESIILPNQSHGNKVLEVFDGSEDLTNTDGLFTKNKELKIGVRTRDCAPVCMSDGEKIGVVHIGWRGLVNGIYDNISQYFNKERLTIYVAPFLNNFEIKKDFCFYDIKEKFREKYFEIKDDKIIFNFKDALASILPSDTIWDSRNTFSDLSLPSNRRGDKNNFVTSVEFNK